MQVIFKAHRFSDNPIALIIFLIIFLLNCYAAWKVFEKAGEEGWKAIIPIYNAYIYQKITFGERYAWTFILFFIPYLGLAFALYSLYEMYKKFFFTDFGAILGAFFPYIANLYIAFNDECHFSERNTLLNEFLDK